MGGTAILPLLSPRRSVSTSVVDINILCHLISVVAATEGFWPSVACCFQ
jgi:hypothetical protein